MPEYTVAVMLQDIIEIVKDGMVFIVPAAILVATVAFVIRWFFDAIDLGRTVFGRR